MPIPLRIAVIGAGAFGRNHLRVLHELSQLPNSARKTERNPLATNAEPPSSLTVSDLKSEQNPSATNAQSNLSIPSSLTTSSREAQHQPQPGLPIHLVAAVDPNPAVRAEVTTRYNIPTFATVDDLLAANINLSAATIAVPTLAHAAVATQLLHANLDVLIEKPLTATLAEADALIALAERKGCILAAGHLERFNPSVTAALPRLTRPMFFEAHRLSIFTPRSLDVDVVLDLMIHDLDILLTMAQSPVTEVRAVGLPVLSPKVDIANVRLEFASGAIANLTASRVSTEQVRKLRLFQPAQYLSLDYARQELLTINIDPTLAQKPSAPGLSGTWVSEPFLKPVRGNPNDQSSRSEAEGSAFATAHPSPGLTFEKLNLPRAEPLHLEIEDFLQAIHTRTPPRVSATAARNALALALDINAAIAAHASTHLT